MFNFHNFFIWVRISIYINTYHITYMYIISCFCQRSLPRALDMLDNRTPIIIHRGLSSPLRL